MDEEYVSRLLVLELAHSLQEGHGLDVAHCAPHLDQTYLAAPVSGDLTDALLNLLGDVGDDLHRLAQILTSPFLLNHCAVDLAGGDVVVSGQLDIKESLIVPQV